MVKTCIRCERKITDQVSVERGYGPTCWEKEGQYVVKYKTTPHPKIEELIAKINRLEKQLFNLQAHPRAVLPPVPNGNDNGQIKERSEIPLMVGGWDVSELQENELFLKMQEVCASIV